RNFAPLGLMKKTANPTRRDPYLSFLSQFFAELVHNHFAPSKCLADIREHIHDCPKEGVLREELSILLVKYWEDGPTNWLWDEQPRTETDDWRGTILLTNVLDTYFKLNVARVSFCQKYWHKEQCFVILFHLHSRISPRSQRMSH